MTTLNTTRNLALSTVGAIASLPLETLLIVGSLILTLIALAANLLLPSLEWLRRRPLRWCRAHRQRLTYWSNT